jgi:hypothetical protein
MEPVAGTLRTMSRLFTCVVVMVMDDVPAAPAGRPGPAAPLAAAGWPPWLAAGLAPSAGLFRLQPVAANAALVIAIRRTFCRRRGRRKGVLSMRIGELGLSDIRWLIYYQAPYFWQAILRPRS